MSLSPASSVSSGAGGQSNVFIVGRNTPTAESNFDNVGTNVATLGERFSDNVDGSWIEWDISIAAGTYAFDFRGFAYDGSGILVFSLDDGTGAVNIDQAPYNANTASADSYAAAPDSSYLKRITGLVIPETGTYTLRATVTGKNASSSGFATNVIYIALTPA